MKPTSLLVAALAVALTGCSNSSSSSKPEPSREARAGCAWSEQTDTVLGVRFLVEDCNGAKPVVHRRANSISIGTGGAVIEIWPRPFAQPAQMTLKERFLSKLTPDEFNGCIVAKPHPDVKGLPQGYESYAIVPGPDYKSKADALRTADPTAKVCGDHGLGPHLSFFFTHPEQAGLRAIYVNAGAADSGFDALSVRLIADAQSAEGFQAAEPENLAMAELAAFAMERDLKRFSESRGQLMAGERESSFVVFKRGPEPVMINEQARLGDHGDTGVRYYFRRGQLVLVRENALETPQGGNAKSQDVVQRRVLLGPQGRIVEARKIVNGRAVELTQDEAATAAALAQKFLGAAKP